MSATWIDRSIAWFSPRAGLERVKARTAFQAHVRAYEGAARGRHTDGWSTKPSSADAEIAVAGALLRDRARDLRRNNPHAAKAVASWINNLVGEGIMPRPNTGSDAKNKKVMEAFKKWAAECDADGQLDFYGLQSLAVGGMIEGGEMLARRRLRRAEDAMHVPLQIQLLEPDFIDATKQGDLPNGNVAIQGIEFNKIGQRAAYWLFAQHPGGATISMTRRLESLPIPAEDVLHLYEKTRTQVRGVTWLAPVIRELRDHADYRFAERIRKKVEASVVGIIVGDDMSDVGLNPETQGGAGTPAVVDSKGNTVESMAPGFFGYARGGKDVKFNAPATVGGFAEYDTTSLRAIAAGMRMPYELLTGDLSQINFSSIRAGLLEFRRLVSTLQWQVIIPRFCQPIWDWFCEAAYAAGMIDDRVVPVEWAPPAFNWVDPYKDVLADVIAVRAGFKSYQEVVASSGRTMAEVIGEFKAWNDMLDEADLTFDSDPRKTTLKGLMQKTVTGEGGSGDGGGAGFGGGNDN